MASCVSPRAAAPSPNQPSATRFSSRMRKASAADRDRQHGREVADHGDQSEAVVGHVDVAVLALRRAVHAAHELREDPPGLDAAHDMDAHVPMQRRADVLRAHGRGDPY
jgi:hypothetical protein